METQIINQRTYRADDGFYYTKDTEYAAYLITEGEELADMQTFTKDQVWFGFDISEEDTDAYENMFFLQPNTILEAFENRRKLISLLKNQLLVTR